MSKRPMNMWEFLDRVDWIWVFIGVTMVASVVGPIVAPLFKSGIR